MNSKSPLNDIEKKTNVQLNDLINLANKIQGANFRDEKTVRKIIAQVARLANVSVPKKTVEQLVKTITNDKAPKDMSSLMKMLKK